MSRLPVTFDRRLKTIVRQHRRLNHGHVHKVTSTGLIVAKPRIYNPKFPLKGIVMVVGAAFMLKAFIYADLGQTDYTARVAALSGASFVEQAGAWIMQPEPATVFVADIFDRLGA